MAEAFPWDTAPPYLLHDHDSIYRGPFRQRVRGMGVREVLTAPSSPWQNPYAERLIGSIRRECLVPWTRCSISLWLKSILAVTMRIYLPATPWRLRVKTTAISGQNNGSKWQ